MVIEEVWIIAYGDLIVLQHYIPIITNIRTINQQI
jgi:hypothetical protein